MLMIKTGIPSGIPVEDTLACDVVFYNPDTDSLVIRRKQRDWLKNETPIGIVVIPSSHNVYGNGACGVMALMSASTSTPDVGSTSNVGIYWGQYGTDIPELYNYKGCSSYGSGDVWTAVQYYSDYTFLPSDQSGFGEKLMNKLPSSDQSCWYYYNNDNGYAPSPYLNDGSRNPDYYNTEIGKGNVLSDFKGKDNTAILISKATTQSNWKTASSITNNSDPGYSPAACACWRYSTIGTKQGDWYLPAMGELGYVCVRLQKINDTISALQSHFGKTFCLLDIRTYWSSSEYSSNYAKYLSFINGGILTLYSKNSSNSYVRPFMQLKHTIKYEFVDMGLSVDWCTCNIGATKPEEYGWYFQWGGTTPYNSDRTPVGGGDAIKFDFNSNCPYWVSGTSSSSTKWSKYTAADSYSSTGVKDGKLILEPEDDAAHVHVGEECRMPTEAEFNELLNACNTTWVTNYNGTGINGRLFTLKADPSKTLFFPGSGYLIGSSWSSAVSYGYCLSSSLYSSNSYYGRGLYFYSSDCYMSNSYRCYGRSVRAVKPKSNNPVDPKPDTWTLGDKLPIILN